MTRPITHDDALRSRLLAETESLVADRGVARLALREIAAAAGTSTTAIYSLFGGKRQLLTAVVDHGFASFGESQRNAAPHGLSALGFAYRDWAKEHPTLYGLMFSGTSGVQVECPPTPDVASNAMSPLMESVTQALAATASTETVTSAAMAIWGQVHGLVSLELAEAAWPGVDWDSAYEAALRGIARAYLPQ